MSDGFVKGLEKKTGRVLVPRKGGWPKERRRNKTRREGTAMRSVFPEYGR